MVGLGRILGSVLGRRKASGEIYLTVIARNSSNAKLQAGNCLSRKLCQKFANVKQMIIFISYTLINCPSLLPCFSPSFRVFPSRSRGTTDAKNRVVSVALHFCLVNSSSPLTRIRVSIFPSQNTNTPTHSSVTLDVISRIVIGIWTEL